MGIYLKDPAATLDYVFDWTAYLAAGETITGHTITATSGITVDSSTRAGAVVTVWLSGGTAGREATVTCRVTTSGGRTDERSIHLTCTER